MRYCFQNLLGWFYMWHWVAKSDVRLKWWVLAWNVRYMWYLFVDLRCLCLCFPKFFSVFFSEVCFPQFTFAMTAPVIEIHDCLTLCWMFRFYAVLRWKKKAWKVAKVGNLERSGRSPGPDEKFRTARAHAISQSDSIRIPDRWEAGKLYFFYLPSVLVSLFFLVLF